MIFYKISNYIIYFFLSIFFALNTFISIWIKYEILLFNVKVWLSVYYYLSFLLFPSSSSSSLHHHLHHHLLLHHHFTYFFMLIKRWWNIFFLSTFLHIHMGIKQFFLVSVLKPVIHCFWMFSLCLCCCWSLSYHVNVGVICDVCLLNLNLTLFCFTHCQKLKYSETCE